MGVYDNPNPPEGRLIPASTSFGRLAGIGSLTGGFWVGDWRVLDRRLCLVSLKAVSFEKTKSAALPLLMSYNTTWNNRIRKVAAWDILPKFRRMRVSNLNNFWVYSTPVDSRSECRESLQLIPIKIGLGRHRGLKSPSLSGKGSRVYFRTAASPW